MYLNATVARKGGPSYGLTTIMNSDARLFGIMLLAEQNESLGGSPVPVVRDGGTVNGDVVVGART